MEQEQCIRIHHEKLWLFINSIALRFRGELCGYLGTKYKIYDPTAECALRDYVDEMIEQIIEAGMKTTIRNVRKDSESRWLWYKHVVTETNA